MNTNETLYTSSIEAWKKLLNGKITSAELDAETKKLYSSNPPAELWEKPVTERGSNCYRSK